MPPRCTGCHPGAPGFQGSEAGLHWFVVRRWLAPLACSLLWCSTSTVWRSEALYLTRASDVGRSACLWYIVATQAFLLSDGFRSQSLTDESYDALASHLPSPEKRTYLPHTHQSNAHRTNIGIRCIVRFGDSERVRSVKKCQSQQTNLRLVILR